MEKKYKLLQDFKTPMGVILKGTISEYMTGYYIFPYVGKEYQDPPNGNGWLSNAFFISDVENYPDWFEEVKDNTISISEVVEEYLKRKGQRERKPEYKIDEAIQNQKQGHRYVIDTNKMDIVNRTKIGYAISEIKYGEGFWLLDDWAWLKSLVKDL